jgi:mRNA-degrading endonuclease RelE of RelBE toxin-antitoxin system
MNTIKWQNITKKDLRKIDRSQRKRIIRAVEQLQEP